MMLASTEASGPRVLVAFASRHGGTREIAAAIARGLSGGAAGRRSGMSAVLAPVEQRPDPTCFDAVVLGSALYEGRWLERAVRYTLEVAAELPGRPTWLFSSGLSAPPHPPRGDEEDARRLAELVGARGHRLFPGRLERRLLSAGEREAWTAASTVTGDLRDWHAVRAWSERIAGDLEPASSLAMAG